MRNSYPPPPKPGWGEVNLSLQWRDNPQLAGVLPKTFELFSSTLLKQLLKRVSEIPATLDYDAFGRIYEYFLGEFARTEGSKGGEFFTPASIVRFIVEVIEPYHGAVFDPASGSGGMFVQSARFVSEHKKDPSRELSIHGHEKVGTTVALSRMNLAMHGLEGDVREANSYYDDPHESTGRFDFVLANPPFNVNAVDKERLEGDVGKNRRFSFGLPRTDNANYLWIQLSRSSVRIRLPAPSTRRLSQATYFKISMNWWPTSWQRFRFIISPVCFKIDSQRRLQRL